MLIHRAALLTMGFLSMALIIPNGPAYAVPKFSLGVSEPNVVAAGTTVSVLTAITNTGPEAISFGPSGSFNPGVSFRLLMAGISDRTAV